MRDELTQQLERKDRLIKQLQTQLGGKTDLKQEFAGKLREKDRKIESMQAEIEKLKDRSDLDRAVKAKDKLMKVIKQREGQIENLTKMIDKFTQREIEFEQKKQEHTDELQILDKKDKAEIVRLKQEIETEKRRADTAINSREEKTAECTRLKDQLRGIQEKITTHCIKEAELEAKVKDLSSQLSTSERNLKTKEREVQRLHEEHKIGGNYGQGTGKTFDQVEARNAELEKENIRLNAMQQTVILFNRANGTFEFIGQP